MKTGVECESRDESLGVKRSVKECANACSSVTLCRFFIYGKGSKTGKCYWEKADSSSCHEGWQQDLYDFYSVPGKFG